MEHILANTATLDPHIILVHGILEQFKTFLKAGLTVGSPENNELYWYLLGLFTEHSKLRSAWAERCSQPRSWSSRARWRSSPPSSGCPGVTTRWNPVKDKRITYDELTVLDYERTGYMRLAKAVEVTARIDWLDVLKTDEHA